MRPNLRANKSRPGIGPGPRTQRPCALQDDGGEVRLAMAAMGQKETKVTDLWRELAITRQTLYQHVAPDGTLRKNGLKVVEGGQARHRHGKKH